MAVTFSYGSPVRRILFALRVLFEFLSFPLVSSIETLKYFYAQQYCGSEYSQEGPNTISPNEQCRHRNDGAFTRACEASNRKGYRHFPIKSKRTSLEKDFFKKCSNFGLVNWSFDDSLSKYSSHRMLIILGLRSSDKMWSTDVYLRTRRYSIWWRQWTGKRWHVVWTKQSNYRWLHFIFARYRKDYKL